MHSDPDKKRPDKFQQGPWGAVPLSAERAAQEAINRAYERKVAFFKDDGPVPMRSERTPLYWNAVEQRFQETPVSDLVHRGPPSGIRLEPAEPRERTVGYWELATWENGFFCDHLAPEEPTDAPPTQNITLSVGAWQPIGGAQWRRYCTMTYTPAAAQ